MKTTIDLPDRLVLEVKLRALREGRKLKEVVADLLRKGLAAPEPVAPSQPSAIERHASSGLPVINCRRSSSSLTPSRVADILASQEEQWLDEAGR